MSILIEVNFDFMSNMTAVTDEPSNLTAVINQLSIERHRTFFKFYTLFSRLDPPPYITETMDGKKYLHLGYHDENQLHAGNAHEFYDPQVSRYTLDDEQNLSQYMGAFRGN